MKHLLHKILTSCIKPFQWSWIWKKFPFNYLFKFYTKLWNKVHYSSKNQIIKTTHYWFQMLLEKDKFIDDNIINFWVWEPNISNIIKMNLKKWDNFLDLWANIWYFSLLASSITYDGGKIFSFEPSKIIFQELNKNIKLNNINNIKYYNLGVWEENIKKELFYNESNPWGSSIINHNYSNTKELIEIVKLDDFLWDTKIDFIKMDIEWFEYSAIKWMLNILKNNNLQMIFEYSPKIYEKLYWNTYQEESIWLLNTLSDIWFHLFAIDYKWNFQEIENNSLFFKKIYNWSWQIDIYCKK